MAVHFELAYRNVRSPSQVNRTFYIFCVFLCVSVCVCVCVCKSPKLCLYFRFPDRKFCNYPSPFPRFLMFLKSYPLSFDHCSTLGEKYQSSSCSICTCTHHFPFALRPMYFQLHFFPKNSQCTFFNGRDQVAHSNKTWVF